MFCCCQVYSYLHNLTLLVHLNSLQQWEPQVASSADYFKVSHIADGSTDLAILEAPGLCHPECSEGATGPEGV